MTPAECAAKLRRLGEWKLGLTAWGTVISDAIPEAPGGKEGGESGITGSMSDKEKKVSSFFLRHVQKLSFTNMKKNWSMETKEYL